MALLVDMYDVDGTVRGVPTQPLLEGVTAHEVAHQWFYAAVGNDQLDEPWLDEALAQYATLAYYRDIYGSGESFRASLERRGQRVEADLPVGLPVRSYTPAEYSAIVYGRGPLFIEALRAEMGPDTFNAFLRDYYQTYLFKVATTADFRQLAEAHCACDLSALFETWVY